MSRRAIPIWMSGLFIIAVFFSSIDTFSAQVLPLPQESRARIPVIINGGFETAGSDSSGAQGWTGKNLPPSDKRVCTPAASSHGNCGFRFSHANPVNTQRSITQVYNPSQAVGGRNDQLFFGYTIKIPALSAGTTFTVTARVDYTNPNLASDSLTWLYTTPLNIDSFMEVDDFLTLKGRVDKITVSFRMSKQGVGRVFVDRVRAVLVTNIPSATPTLTASPSHTKTITPTASATQSIPCETLNLADNLPRTTPCPPTKTITPTSTPTDTDTPFPTETLTPLPSLSPTSTPTDTDTPLPTETPTPLPSLSPTSTPTDTDTPFPTETLTPSPSPSPTDSRTPVIITASSSTLTPMPSRTPSFTPTFTRTPSHTPTRTPSRTPTNTLTPTITLTPSITFTFTPSLTPTETPVISLTPSLTLTPTLTRTITPSRTPSQTFTPHGFTNTPSRTPLITNTRTATRTPTETHTPGGPTFTPSVTRTPTRTQTPTAVITPIPPSAVDDFYDVRAHVFITHPANALTGNDTLGFPIAAPIAMSGKSAQGGNYVVLSHGGFTYEPPPDFTGVDTFTYTLNNGAQSSATVTLTVSGPIVWFIHRSASLNSANLGTLADPFDSPFEFESAKQAGGVGPSAGEHIYLVEPTGANHDGPIRLEPNMQLHGSLAGIQTLIAPLPVGSGTLPNRTVAQIDMIVGDAIRVSTGNTIDSIQFDFMFSTANAIGQHIPGMVSPLRITNVSTSGSTANAGCFIKLDDTFGSGEVYLELGSILSTRCTREVIWLKNIHRGQVQFNGPIVASGYIYLDSVASVTFNNTVTLNGLNARVEAHNISGTVSFNDTISIGQTVPTQRIALDAQNLTGTLNIAKLDAVSDGDYALWIENDTPSGMLTLLGGALKSTNSQVVFLQNLTVNIVLDSVTSVNLPVWIPSVFQQGLTIQNFIIYVLNWS